MLVLGGVLVLAPSTLYPFRVYIFSMRTITERIVAACQTEGCNFFLLLLCFKLQDLKKVEF